MFKIVRKKEYQEVLAAIRAANKAIDVLLKNNPDNYCAHCKHGLVSAGSETILCALKYQCMAFVPKEGKE